VTIILLFVLASLLVAGLVAAILDLVRAARSLLERRRVRGISRRGWDWPAFERDLASYVRERRAGSGSLPPGAAG
jgi:hypothetical protein